MFVPATPAETTNFMILGFIFVFVPMLVYIWSLASRRKKLQTDLKVLKELSK